MVELMKVTMPDESCRGCGGVLIKYSVCAGCRGTMQKICNSCTSKTEQQIHDHCFNRMELIH